MRELRRAWLQFVLAPGVFPDTQFFVAAHPLEDASVVAKDRRRTR